MPPVLLQTPVPWANSQLDYGSGVLKWWAFRETTGTAPATFQLFDGTNNQGQLLMPMSLGAGESTRDFTGHLLIPYYVGLWLQVLSGTVEGAMQTDDLPEGDQWAMPVVIIGSVDIGIEAS